MNIDFEMEYENNDRLRRWEDIRREQFSFFSNLLITISFWYLTFLLSAAEDNSILVEFVHRDAIGWSVVFLIGSIIFWLLLAWNRLKDFRLTVEKIRSKGQSDELSKKIRYIGIWTWKLLVIEWIFLIISFVILVISIIENLL